MDKGHEEIAKSLMLEILLENGYIDRWNSAESRISNKWIKKIAPIAGMFFEKHPELLTNEHLETIAEGGIEGDSEADLDVIYKDYPDIKTLREILNEYFNDCCGVY